MRVAASILAIFMFSLIACGQNKEKLILTVDGKTSYKIVLPEHPLPSELKAAERLSHYFLTISSANLEIISEHNIKESKGENYIFLGQTKYSTHVIKNQHWALLKTDGIIVRSIDKDIILAGNGPRSTLYAVYQFLEENLNCRWWTPESRTIPKNKNIVIDPINYSYNPVFSYRSHFSFNSINDPEFITILHENGDNQSLNVDWGGKVGILGWEHTFSTILPPEKYFKAHPEWYSDPENSHIPCSKDSKMPAPQSTQLCMSNVTMQKVFIENTMKWISENPSFEIISISQNDTEGYCHCQACQEVIDKEGAPSGLLLRFVNNVAAAVNKKYPDKKIETLSYLFSAKPPKITRPANNVIMRFAPIGADFGYPINSVNNRDIRAEFDDWAKISKQNFFWGYNTNFNLLLLPHPSLYHLKDDLLFLQRHNFTGVFIQDNTNPESYGFFTNMQSWIIGHLLWNPSLNYEKLLDEYMKGYYGDAGPFMKEYFLLIQSRFLSRQSRLTTFNTDFSFLTNGGTAEFDEIFQKAFQSVKKNNVLLDRVKKEKISLDYTKLYLYTERVDKISKRLTNIKESNYQIQYRQFFNDLNAFRIDNVFVKNALVQYKERLVNDLETKHKKDIYTAKSDNGYIFQQDKFDYYKAGYVSNIVSDQNASDSKAASIVGTSIDWAVRIVLQDLNQDLFVSDWDLNPYLRIRLKNNQRLNAGSVVGFGIYDTKKNKSIIDKEVPISKLVGEKYFKCEINNIKLQRDYIIWFGVSDKNNEIQDLLIDKVEFIRKNR